MAAASSATSAGIGISDTGHHRVLVPGAAVQLAAGGLLADAPLHAAVVDIGAVLGVPGLEGVVQHLVADDVLAPLLEEERNVRRGALVAQAPSPVGLHRPSIAAGLASDDDPIKQADVATEVD